MGIPSLDELANYSLRGDEVRELFAYLNADAPVFPLSLLAVEGTPYG